MKEKKKHRVLKVLGCILLLLVVFFVVINVIPPKKVAETNRFLKD